MHFLLHKIKNNDTLSKCLYGSSASNLKIISFLNRFLNSCCLTWVEKGEKNIYLSDTISNHYITQFYLLQNSASCKSYDFFSLTQVKNHLETNYILMTWISQVMLSKRMEKCKIYILILQELCSVWIGKRLDIIEDKRHTGFTSILLKWALNYQIHPECITKKHWIVIFRHPFF